MNIKKILPTATLILSTLFAGASFASKSFPELPSDFDYDTLQRSSDRKCKDMHTQRGVTDGYMYRRCKRLNQDEAMKTLLLIAEHENESWFKRGALKSCYAMEKRYSDYLAPSSFNGCVKTLHEAYKNMMYAKKNQPEYADIIDAAIEKELNGLGNLVVLEMSLQREYNLVY